MGRTPKSAIRARAARAGPGHWIHCQTALFAGGGIAAGLGLRLLRQGSAAYPANDPVRPERLAARPSIRPMGIAGERPDLHRPRETAGALVDEYQPLPLFG